MAFLEMRGITKRFPGVLALDRVDFEAERGEIHAVVGQNGAGKSTLMKILGGAFSDYEGEIFIDGKPVNIRSPKDSRAAGVAVIYQELNLVPDLTVAENIFLGREPTKFLGLVDFAKMREEARKVLAQLDPTIDPDAKVRELPVGKQQLTEIAKGTIPKRSHPNHGRTHLGSHRSGNAETLRHHPKTQGSRDDNPLCLAQA
jgi:monosaccharide ABC transporter ATP-binding protein, CUT2 family (TC 3.A.1.2.-)